MVIGNPVAGLGSIEISTVLNASIMAGMVLDISSLLGKNIDNGNNYVSFNSSYALNIDKTFILDAMSDTYQVLQLTHHGSTHQGNFQTDIYGKYGVNNTMGGNDHKWREWYAKTNGLDGVVY